MSNLTKHFYEILFKKQLVRSEARLGEVWDTFHKKTQIWAKTT